jgi:type 1 fimbriae regulatory protein FimB/type 1 fimbriae regulatory protein FimE
MDQISHLGTGETPAPIHENVKVTPVPMPVRGTNAAVRSREHLTPTEVESIIKAARKAGRYGARDAALILVAFTHGLRVTELVRLQWSAVDFELGLLHVVRVKRGTPSTHPLRGAELRALRALKSTSQSPFIFTSERGGPMTAANVRHIVKRIGVAAKLPFPIHPHMLRHAVGYKLALEGVDTRAIQLYLGHKSIEHTTRYTALSPGRFNGFFKD